MVRKLVQNVKMAMSAIIGLCMLFSAAHPARAEAAFSAGSMWRGFAQSSVANPMRGIAAMNLGDSQHDGYLIGLLFVEGRWRQIKIISAADGSVDVLSIGADKGLKAHGHVIATGDRSYFARFTYQSGDHRGYFELLRAFPPGTTADGRPFDPYRSVFPPGPTVGGKYVSAGGNGGLIALLHNPPSDSVPPAFFTGSLAFQDLHFNIVGAISSHRFTDGGYPVEMLGQSALFSEGAPFVHISGELLPAVRPGDKVHLRGVYSVMNGDGTVVDRGVFDMVF